MIKRALKILLRPLKKIINWGYRFFEENHQSRMIRKGGERSLFLTRYDDLFWLKKGLYIDDCIINQGIYEESCTIIAKRFICPGNVAFDIGANIGYFSVIFSRLAGPEGHVYSFEPTTCYRDVLKVNLEANKIRNAEIIPFGLSNKAEQLEIQIDGTTATLQFPGGGELSSHETISLITLDAFVKERNISRVDFIKIDVDGHEPAILEGGWETIDRFKPLVLLEINHTNYLQYGINAMEFYALLKSKELYIYDENTLEEYKNIFQFLYRCGNFHKSANVLLSYNKLT